MCTKEGPPSRDTQLAVGHVGRKPRRKLEKWICQIWIGEGEIAVPL